MKPADISKAVALVALGALLRDVIIRIEHSRPAVRLPAFAGLFVFVLFIAVFI